MYAKKETILRTIILFISTINGVFLIIGKNPIPWSEEEIYSMLSAVIQIAVTAWSWWKNNSFTQNAVEADEYLHTLNKTITD